MKSEGARSRVFAAGWLGLPAIVAITFAVGLAPTASAQTTPSPNPPLAPFEGEEIRDRLTEREDENRVETPYTIDLWGRPLSLTGEYEVGFAGVDQIARGDPPEGDDRALFEQEIEGEGFYTVGRPLSVLFQLRMAMEYDLLGETRNGISDLFFERGEMWLFTEKLWGSPFDVAVGRIELEDDRLFWFDEELDMVRVTAEVEAFDAELAVAYEIAPTRSDEWEIDPEEDERLRVIFEISRDLGDDHGMDLFAIYDEDLSEEAHLGARMRTDEEDESDARLFWLGPRVIGGFDFGRRGILGYWADGAWLWGRETRLEFEEQGGGRSVVTGVDYREVSGWAFDVGVSYFFDASWEPRVTLAYARASGDDKPEEGTARAFRQTGLQSNETGFGGVQRFNHYGRLLGPELSNLSVFTAGIGTTLFRTSSADLVYHRYRLLAPADELRDSLLVTELNGRDKDLGQGVDAIIAIEEGERFEFEIAGSLFRAGEAFGKHRGEWSFGAFAVFRAAF